MDNSMAQSSFYITHPSRRADGHRHSIANHSEPTVLYIH